MRGRSFRQMINSSGPARYEPLRGPKELYQRARPAYPSELYDHLLQVTGLSSGARLLEVGCATGTATVPLAQRGFHITCLEPGSDLAAATRADLAGFDVEVVEARFEDWTP